MKGIKISILLIFIGVLFLSSLSSSAICGIILHKQSYQLIPGKGGAHMLQTWTEYYQDNMVAVYQNNAIFITNIGSDTLINILPSRKIYAVNSIGDFMKRIQNIMQQIKAQQLYKQNKSGNKLSKIRIKKGGETKNILGYPSKKIEIYENDKKVRELWITDKLPLRKEVDIDKAREKKFQIEKLLTPISGTKDVELSPEYQNLLKGGKIPMIITTFSNGVEEIERVNQVEIVSIPKHIFEVPKEYKKVPIEKFMQH